MITSTSTKIGRARSVLVFGYGENSKALVSTVIAQIPPEQGGWGNRRLSFTGPVKMVEQVIEHLTDLVLPVVDRMLQLLGVPRYSFELSVANLDAASTADIGLSISGYSADVAVLLAMIAAALELPVSLELVATGHIASTDGQIRMVKSIPAKLDAAVDNPHVKRFVYPSDEIDQSLQTLSPNEQERITQAVTSAKSHISITTVANVNELVQTVFGPDAVVLASLQSGFFERDPTSTTPHDPIGQAVRFLVDDNDNRFWSAMNHHMLTAENSATSRLLTALANYHISCMKYPPQFGHKLMRLVESLPPSIRRVKTTYPLFPMNLCIQLGQFVSETDHEDFQRLINVVSGLVAPRDQVLPTTKQPLPTEADNSNAAVDAVIDEISTEALTQKICLPIDNARATYIMDSVVVESNEAFHDAIFAFYQHVLRHINNATVSMDEPAIRAEALAILDQAFARKGGLEAAQDEAQHAAHGGMRLVLDAMTEHLKSQQQAQHVDLILKEAINPLSWDDRVSFITVLLTRIGSLLPPAIAKQPPERFARNIDAIVHAYVNSMDQVKQVLRSM